ncbi:Di-copper centre-containing protein [Mollisia scopiformis]|uniref:Di-copper centre-containing protein n=1 Tax=Mollisia scopiformis TaxID=149040 RepID=A0A194XE82_MOLSC|nr:Di-copper centre-containing protein [Mollisia scopiformis]KUJ18454.1 Di-copper centre-containing protein [Mollisia scopiformis]
MRHSFRALYTCVFLCCWLSTVLAIPTTTHQSYPSYDYGVNPTSLLKRQTFKYYAVTGIQTGSGPNDSTPLRLEIRDLEKDPITWTLYILGLDMLQYTPQTEMLSWYQIAAIHGRPFVSFDNVPPKAGNENNGYCSHVSILFPTWHRPYLVLYEQVLYGMIQQIAQQYPSGTIRDQYITAAANFRIPYWDWAMIPPSGESVLPASVGQSPSVVVDGPAGSQTIANPLWSYQFKPLDSNALPDPPFNQYTETMRYPTTQDASATSQNNLVAQQLDNNAASFRSRLYVLLTNYHDYTTFSNEAWIKDTDPSSYDSIESIHDQIHGLVGSGGHMMYIDYSAFDPTFWLHHAMIDRCFAMWQILNPNSFVVPEPAMYNTFTESAGQTQDVNSPLDPFHKDVAGGLWSSDGVRSTEAFGYAYPETVAITGVDVNKQVIVALNTLYGPAASGSSKLKPRSRLRARDGDMDLGNEHTEWIANIRVQKYALNAPFFVHIFIGPFNPDPTSWSFEPNLAGTQSIFVKAASSTPASCNCSLDQMIAAAIPLTHSLNKNIADRSLNSLNVEDVTPFLAQHLSYRVILFNGTAVKNEDVPSLKISIVSVEVQDPENNSQLPVWKNAQGHLDVSMGSGCQASVSSHE